MLEFIQDSNLQFIIIILFSALTIAVMVIIYLFQRNKKLLSYEIESKTPILTEKEELNGKLTVQYEGKIVPNVYITVLKIINSGNESIKTSDFETPIKVYFGPKIEILSAEVIETNPNEIEMKINQNEEYINIEPLLLNKKDYFRLKIISTNPYDQFKIDGRIVGIKAIEPVKESKLVFITMSIASIFIFFGFPIGIVCDNSFIIGISLLISYGLLILSVLLSKKFRRTFLKTTSLFFIRNN